jgi:hypothetical protein
VDGAGIAADPPAVGSSDASTAQLTQMMASFGANAAVSSAPATVPSSADTSQQTFLSLPH